MIKSALPHRSVRPIWLAGLSMLHQQIVMRFNLSSILLGLSPDQIQFLQSRFK